MKYVDATLPPHTENSMLSGYEDMDTRKLEELRESFKSLKLEYMKVVGEVLSSAQYSICIKLSMPSLLPYNQEAKTYR